MPVADTSHSTPLRVLSLPYSEVSSRPAKGTDAELLALCGEYLALHMDWHRIASPWAYGAAPAPARIEARMSDLQDAAADVAADIAQQQPVTREGMAAMARVIMAGFELDEDGVSPSVCDDPIMFALVRALGAATVSEMLGDIRGHRALQAEAPAPREPLAVIYARVMDAAPIGADLVPYMAQACALMREAIGETVA